ncbi:MAG TPA: amino acid ABC transporter permease [Alphaproteobacteria bacterium]|nr:amino acid ABC transporter permease [Alphaproteobacteria bacterium]
MHFDTAIVLRHIPELARGFELTVLLVLVSLVIGVGLGAVACTGKLLGRGLLGWIAAIYVAVMRGVPEMVVMFWIYYCGPLVLNTRLSSFSAAATAMSLYAGAFLAEIFRAGILAVPRGQTEAARALGIPATWTWINVILPQALRLMIPAFIGLVTLVVKVSGLASAIGVGELVYQASIVSGDTYRYFEMFSSVGIFYFLLIFPLSQLAQHYERRLARRSR